MNFLGIFVVHWDQRTHQDMLIRKYLHLRYFRCFILQGESITEELFEYLFTQSKKKFFKEAGTK